MSEAEKAREVADMLETWTNGLACLTDENEKRAAQNYMPLLREAARILRHLRCDTIEECARVAEQYGYPDTVCQYEKGFESASQLIRAAIRKLAQEG